MEENTGRQARERRKEEGTVERGDNIIKKPNNEHGLRIFHDTEDDLRLIGYIREEKDDIIFTSPEKIVTIISENRRL